MYDEHAWIFFSPIKKKQRDLDYQACSSDMVGYFFQGFNFFFFEKNTHACSSDMRVILPYTDLIIDILQIFKNICSYICRQTLSPSGIFSFFFNPTATLVLSK